MSDFIKHAIHEAQIGIECNHGGPFGAVIVKSGKIISKAHNEVIKTNDPTAHAEVNAIRKASQKLQSFDLSGCEIYSTCEPCPMCMAAILWSRIDTVYFGSSKLDAANIGFDDMKFYEVINGKKSSINLNQIDSQECLDLFNQWCDKKDKVIY